MTEQAEKQAKHAQGDWEVADWTRDFYDGVGDFLYRFRPVVAGDDAVAWLDTSEPKSKPNARLIAAAPDLLAAIKQFIEDVDEPSEPDKEARYWGTCQWMEWVAQGIEDLKEAAKRAEGGEVDG